eukprot:Gb_06540 [translate_table: standard]
MSSSSEFPTLGLLAMAPIKSTALVAASPDGLALVPTGSCILSPSPLLAMSAFSILAQT